MNERDLFIRSLQIKDPVRRLEVIREEVAGDEALRLRLEGLLQAYDRSEDFLESPPEALTAPNQKASAHALGSMIGPYKLRELLGEGGMGNVYVAEQDVPIHRKVALKIIKPGMDSRQVLARFEAERQALAIMDHPNIAKVLDAGTPHTHSNPN